MEFPPTPQDSRSRPYFHSSSGVPATNGHPSHISTAPTTPEYTGSPPIPGPYSSTTSYNPAPSKRRTLPPPLLPPRPGIYQSVASQPLNRQTQVVQPCPSSRPHEIASLASSTTTAIADVISASARSLLDEIWSSGLVSPPLPSRQSNNENSLQTSSGDQRPAIIARDDRPQHEQSVASSQQDVKWGSGIHTNASVSSPIVTKDYSHKGFPTQVPPPRWDQLSYHVNEVHIEPSQNSYEQSLQHEIAPSRDYSTTTSVLVDQKTSTAEAPGTTVSTYPPNNYVHPDVISEQRKLYPHESSQEERATMIMLPRVEAQSYTQEATVSPASRLQKVSSSGPPLLPKSGLLASASVKDWRYVKVPTDSPTGTPLRACPKTVPIDYPIDWYFYPATPDFLICSNCYATKIEVTPYSSEFTRELKIDAKKRLCMFHSARMTTILWPQAVVTGALDDVLQFMERRSRIKACNGTTRTNSTAKIKYFSHKNKEPVDGFIVCEACYEDIVLAKPFGHDFEPYSGLQTEEKFWACDAAIPAVRRAFLNHNDAVAWADAARLGVKRLNLESCPGARSGDTTRAQWYKPTKHIEGFTVCETCYYDRIVNTQFMDKFEFAAPMWQVGWSCDFSAWSVSFAWEAAIWKEDYDQFWNTANKILHSPFCAPEGMKSDLWYTLAPEPGLEDFSVCPACYEGIFCSFNCGEYFIPKTFKTEEEKPVACSMWRETSRARMYLFKFDEAVDVLRFSIFAKLVNAVCSVLSCPRDTAWTNRHWYGYTDALFCEECYALFVKDTSLAQQGKLELNRVVVPEAKICSIYSPRMRGKWTEACSSGDVQPFLDFAQHRSEVFSRTMPEVRMLIEMMQMRQMMAMSMGFMSMMTNAGDSINNMAGSTSESWSVTTSDGFHGTGGSELGAQRQADFERSMSQVSNMNDVAKGTFLENLWRAVE